MYLLKFLNTGSVFACTNKYNILLIGLLSTGIKYTMVLGTYPFLSRFFFPRPWRTWQIHLIKVPLSKLLYFHFIL